MSGQDGVCWLPWDDRAFERARAEGKPVFLSISASWCHWCHVMDGESFSHPEVIRQLNNRFIPVRVDSDKRPDINGRYNMGGWPTVAVLDARGEVVTGATYLPTGQLLGLLARYASLPQPGSEPAPVKRTEPVASPEMTRLDDAMSATVAALIERAYDRTFGGFGSAPKFPQPWAVECALRRHARTGETKWLEMATRTLDAMRDGELYDPVDGGFFRYATSDDWSQPHDEKLLDVNARLLSLYLLGYHLTGESAYRATAQTILDYLFNVLAVDGQPWFGGSQSADRDYYALSQEARLDADAPPVDRTLYVDRNAMAASALLLAAQRLEKAAYQRAAVDLIEHLWSRCRLPDATMFHYDDGTPAGAGLLSDQAWMLVALLDEYDAAGDRAALDRAEALAASMERQLWDGGRGGYWDRPPDTNAAGLLRVPLKPLAENAVAAIALTRLSHATGQPRYHERAGRTLHYLATIFSGFKHHAAPFGVALERWLHPDERG